MAGYMHFEQLSLADAFLNTAMLLGGMGPVNAPQTMMGRSLPAYSRSTRTDLYRERRGAGDAVVHRVLHIFHWHPE